jgi:hypothetical protein
LLWCSQLCGFAALRLCGFAALRLCGSSQPCSLKNPSGKISKFRLVIGDYFEMDLIEAQNKALSLNSRIRNGIDVSAKTKRLEQQRIQADQLTFQQVYELYYNVTQIPEGTGKEIYHLHLEPTCYLRLGIYPSNP